MTWHISDVTNFRQFRLENKSKKQTEFKDCYVDLQRHVFSSCLKDLAISGGMTRKR